MITFRDKCFGLDGIKQELENATAGIEEKDISLTSIFTRPQYNGSSVKNIFDPLL
jgi:hypothetical protein